jgi:hypothetical protein
MVELSGGPGSTCAPPGQHLGGHRLASLYRAVSVARRAASSTLFKYALVQVASDVPKRWQRQRSHAGQGTGSRSQITNGEAPFINLISGRA